MIPLASVKVKFSHILEYVNSTPWAITEDKLDLIHDILNTRCDGKEVDLASVEAALGRELRNEYGVVNQDGNAVIPLIGVISKRMNLFHSISGGFSTELAQKSIEAALDDPDVERIVLKIDSPGGSVDGVKELVDYIYESRGRKPITAFIDGMGASAAYWIASAADEIVAYDTATVGHIGVFQAHYDRSKAYEDAGVKKNFIYAGKYKVIGNDTAPLSTSDKNYLQSQVDAIYSIFVESVARNRGVSTEAVLKEMADGRVFIGKDALRAGLIDRIGTFTSTLSQGRSMVGLAVSSVIPLVLAEAGLDKEVKSNLTDKKEAKSMNLQELKEAHSSLVHAIEEEARKGYVSVADFQKLEGEAEKLRTECDKLDTVNKDLVKTLSLLEEKRSAELADSIKRSLLFESDVPENLHGKVMGMVDHRKYTRDGDKFEEGDESVKAFTDAFKVEVSDWEERLGKPTSVGLREHKGAASSNDEELGRELARRATGKIRSDVK